VALSAHDAFSAGRRQRRGRRARRAALSEINVTPLVDVMLVLLMVFMVSAPLLTSGIALDLPKTQAGAIDERAAPLTVSIRADGSIFVGDDRTALSSLPSRLLAKAHADRAQAIFVRADGKVAYAQVAQVMGALSAAGFTKIDLITDTGGPALKSDRTSERSGPTP
jgi:biopolymer transport protein TolR